MSTVEHKHAASGAASSEVRCLGCDRLLTDPVSRARRCGPECWRRRHPFRQLALPLNSEIGPASDALWTPDVATEQATPTVEGTEPTPDTNPSPKLPHAYTAEPGDTTKDWADRPAAPCRWCQLPRRHQIHRQRRSPRTAASSQPRRGGNAYADAWHAREKARLGERDD